MNIPLILIIVLGSICYFIIPLVLWFFNRNKFIITTIIILTIIYTIILFFGVTSKIDIDKTVSISFDYSHEWFNKNINYNILKINNIDLIINLIMLMPIGLVFVYFSRRKFLKNVIYLIIIGLSAGVIIETIQFVLPIPRSVQLSDVIFNTISVILGGLQALSYELIVNKIKKKKNLN